MKVFCTSRQWRCLFLSALIALGVVRHDEFVHVERRSYQPPPTTNVAIRISGGIFGTARTAQAPQITKGAGSVQMPNAPPEDLSA
jgi:hypothetical protein